MAVFELEHPIGQSIEKIHTAMILGLAEVPEIFGDKTVVSFRDPFMNESGISTLVVASWITKNRTTIDIVLQPSDKPEWLAKNEEGVVPVRPRVIIQNMLGLVFPVPLSGGEVKSSYLRFDVLDEGILFIAGEANKIYATYGKYEGEAYDRLAVIANELASIGELAIYADAV